MGTAMDRATELMTVIVDTAASQNWALPSLQYTQAGDPVVGDESVVVGALSVTPYSDPMQVPTPGRCAPLQQVNLVAYIARRYVCQRPDGSDDPDLVEAASDVMQVDMDLMWDAIYAMNPYLGPDSVNVAWTITGGLVYTVGSLTIGVL